jgi:DNA invertase Pin-like site-specific DNA recombinase
MKRQREAVTKFAKFKRYDLIAEYSDDGVKGADPVNHRPGFAAMLDYIAGNGVRAIIVETASRFARDLIVQETGWRMLREAGITLIATDKYRNRIERCFDRLKPFRRFATRYDRRTGHFVGFVHLAAAMIWLR